MKKLLAVLVLAVLSIAAAPTSPVEDEIRTRKLVLVDAAGKVRATLSTSADSNTVLLAFRTPSGEGLMHLAVHANGESTISIFDLKNARVVMAVKGLSTGISSGLIVYDGQGRAIHNFTTPR